MACCLQEKVFTLQSGQSEDLAILELIKAASLSRQDVAVFERGVSKRTTPTSLSEGGIGFVTRIATGARYQEAGPSRLGEPPERGSLFFTEDRQVHLFDTKCERAPVTFRLIKGEGIESGAAIWLLTNLSTAAFSAEQVSELYRRRWDIEVFFKFLKREPDLGHLPVGNLNGIIVVLYAKLIGGDAAQCVQGTQRVGRLQAGQAALRK